MITTLYSTVKPIRKNFTDLRIRFDSSGYQLLKGIKDIDNFSSVIQPAINFKRESWLLFLDREPTFYKNGHDVFREHDDFFERLSELDKSIESLKSNFNHKIIVGKAGAGKTHLTAHLINTILKNNDQVIFLKAKQFNGDDVNLDDRLIKVMRIPFGYSLTEVLEKLNTFAKEKDKRCFILIDALNETTKHSIGFSNIWKTYLQDFINQINLYPYLYIVCTLRISYINEIWSVRPSNIEELKGFTIDEDLREACEKYFDFYKIKPLNWHTADLSYFSVPLLLDLFCKLTNEKRKNQVEIELGIHIYVQVFENYVTKLISEVKTKLNFQKDRPIKNGFKEVATKFIHNNEAILSVEDFNDAFDKDDDVSIDKSVARYVLEGYLVFIKDFVEEGKEVVKHTQQEIGGYLLAKKISDDFLNIIDLVRDKEFIEKVIGDDRSKHHQLRLDILKFIIALRPEVIQYLNDLESLRLSWWYLYNGNPLYPKEAIRKKLLEDEKTKLILTDVLNISWKFAFTPNHELNFSYIATVLNRLELWDFDRAWTFIVYKNADNYVDILQSEIQDIRSGTIVTLESEFLFGKFVCYLTATTIRDLRDLATIYLVEFGKKHPISLLELAEYFSRVKDLYIYERVVSCCYGVSLILQNDDRFVKEDLPLIATKLFQLQFSEQPSAPVYNYIVIDSIKHLLDLAIWKDAISFSEADIKRVSNYEFIAPHPWISPSEEQSTTIHNSSYMSYPDPIGMDFGIYTIPRLIERKEINDRDAIANVFKRIYEMSYQNLKDNDFADETFRMFYWGSSKFRNAGKVDRLGKKYSWKAFYDYAGYLLLNKQLAVFEKNSSGSEYYVRLSDVDIDISMPKKDYKRNVRIFDHYLFPLEGLHREWYKDLKIDLLIRYLRYQFDHEEYTMLYGSVDQKLDEEYKTRSFLLVEPFFIKKDESISNLKLSLEGQVFDWDMDVHFSVDRLRHVYFGELYWADNIKDDAPSFESIPTGETVARRRRLTFSDTIEDTNYDENDIGKEVEERSPERLIYQSEPALSEYLWETNSKVLEGFSEYYPSIKMGKQLRLLANPLTGQILDQDRKECFQCVEFENQNGFSNTFNYIRSDLLMRYMTDNDLALVYQIKQHSYEHNVYNFRAMKFIILE